MSERDVLDRLAGALWGVDFDPPDARRIAVAMVKNDPGLVAALTHQPARPGRSASDGVGVEAKRLASKVDAAIPMHEAAGSQTPGRFALSGRF